MRPDALERTDNKYLLELSRKSTSCLSASSIMPSVTLPCHTSLFFSVDPDRHGITTNTWMPPVRPIDSLMDSAKKYGLKTAMFYNWEFLRDLNRPGSLDNSDYRALKFDYRNHPDNFQKDLAAEREMTDRVLQYYQEEDPDLCFIYYGLTDEAGHNFSWMSDKYLEALGNAENCVRRIRTALSEDYQVIVTADHGGHEKDHGKDIPEDMTIPMVFSGSAFTPGLKLTETNLKDIAPTIAKLLGFKKPQEWIGNEII